MYIITVIPISRGIFKEELTYYGRQKPEIGNIVKVPLRLKRVLALVVKVDDVRVEKGRLKRLPFKVRKIEFIIGKKILPSNFIKAAEDTARYFVGTLGQIISQFSPVNIYESTFELKDFSEEQQRSRSAEKQVLALPYLDRVSWYKRMSRECFAHNESLFIYAPTRNDCERLYEHLATNLSGRVFLFHGGLGKKEERKRWHAAHEDPRPIIVIATSSFLSFTKKDLSTYIVEFESRNHKALVRPFHVARHFLERLAERNGRRIIFADTVPSLRIYYQIKKQNLEILESLPHRLRGLVPVEIVDMRASDNVSGQEKKIAIISTPLEKALEEVLSRGGRGVLYVNRKGYAPTTLCQDCGDLLSCKTCHLPLVLLSHPDRVFVCPLCKHKEKTEIRCQRCGSWKLYIYGIGIERAVEEVTKLFPHQNILQMDSLVTPSPKRAYRIIEQFYAEPGSILIGTEMCVGYLRQPVPIVGVVTLDAIFSLPDFNTFEKVFRLSLHLREHAQEKYIIQTRRKEALIFQHIVSGSIDKYIQSELKTREKFSYPPAVVLIKISRTGSEERTRQDVVILEEKLAKWKPLVTPGLSGFIRGKFSLHLIIRVNDSHWPDEELRILLADLPPVYSIDINPVSLL